MKLNLFKNIEKKPSSIVAMASNNSTIVIFRKNRTVELVDSRTLGTYVTMGFEYKVVSSKFIDQYVVVCGTKCEKLAFFNTHTLETTCLDINGLPLAIDVRQASPDCRWGPVYYSIGRTVYEWKDYESNVFYHGTTETTAMLAAENEILILGDAEGRIRALKDRKVMCEMHTSRKRINMICHVSGNSYACVSDDGSFSYFDVDLGIALQTSAVRQSPLNVCAYVNDKLHFCGADSRVIAFSRTGMKFIKSYQIDTHYAEVKNIVVDNGRIVTSGKDTILSIVWPVSNKYLDNKVFHKAVELGVSSIGKEFYINCRSSIEFYSFDERGSSGSNSTGRVRRGYSKLNMANSSKGTFKLSESSVERIGYRRQQYRHPLRITVDGNALCSSVSPDFTHLAYSNANETRVLDLNIASKTRASIRRDRYEPANRLIMTNELMILQNYKYEVVLINMNSNEVVRRIGFDNYKEYVHLVRDVIILSHSKKVYSVNDAKDAWTLNVDGDMIGACECDEETFIVFTMLNCLDAKKKYVVYRVAFEDHFSSQIKTFESYALITSVSCLDGKIAFTNNNSIQILDEEMREEKYPLGSIIYGCMGMKEEAIAIQDSWSNVRLRLPSGVFKEKFSNK
ncbi:hypothetical protein HK407_06g11500 [Ordospora pajunii]|uniref:uncharacterized protein n=1 Tax=Ordospora pajunii TaxID=3039483 RepID=UPI00295264B8|nr:uncharacterized protein HK407_06g11500 [Ordospora pajunii]KAH9411319.1 hypothetical protein HK407_06g11500 [Ordospora pajunii]